MPSLEPGKALLRTKSPQPTRDPPDLVQSQPQLRERLKSPSPNRNRFSVVNTSDQPKLPERFRSPEPPNASQSVEHVLNGDSKNNGPLNSNIKTSNASQLELADDSQGISRKKVVKVVRRVVRRVLPAEEDAAATTAMPSVPQTAVEQPKPLETPKPTLAFVPKIMKMPVFSFKHDSIKKEEKDDISAGLASLMSRGRTREPRPRPHREDHMEIQEEKKEDNAEKKEGSETVVTNVKKPEAGETAPKLKENISVSLPPSGPAVSSPVRSPVAPPVGLVSASKITNQSQPPGFIPPPKPSISAAPARVTPAPKPAGFVPAPKPPPLSSPPGFIPAPKTSPLTPPSGFIPKPAEALKPSSASTAHASIPDPKSVYNSTVAKSTPVAPKAASASAPAKPTTLSCPAPKPEPFAPPAGFIPTPKQLAAKSQEVLLAYLLHEF